MKSKLIYAFLFFSFFSKLAFAEPSRSPAREKVETFVGGIHMVEMAHKPEVILVVSGKEVYRLHIYSHLRGVTLNNMRKRVEVKAVRVKNETDVTFPTLKVKNLVPKRA